MSASEQLSASQHKAILALARGATVEEAASCADVTSRTVRRWRRDDENFEEVLSEARQEAFKEGISSIQGATKRAARVLITALDAEVEPSRLSAARFIFQHALKSDEIERRLNVEELEERLEELERLAYQRRRGFNAPRI